MTRIWVERRLVPLAIAGIAVLWVAGIAEAVALKVQDGVVSGRVFESATGKGIPGLVVKLVPPQASKQPQRITTTDAKGRFRLAGQPLGQYLFEIRQGSTLLYRRVINTSANDSLVVSLKRK